MKFNEDKVRELTSFLGDIDDKELFRIIQERLGDIKRFLKRIWDFCRDSLE